MEQNWLAIIVTLPVNLMIIFCMYVTISKGINEKRRREESIRNLRSCDKIYINLSKEEKDMLDALTRFNGFKSSSQFIHSIIKQEDISDIAV